MAEDDKRSSNEGWSLVQLKSNMSDTIQPYYEAAPGTEILIDQEENGASLHSFQHVAHRDGRILLVPQPSLTDANDPLRWPLWKKWLTFSNALFYAFNGAVTGPMMAGGIVFGKLAIYSFSWNDPS